MMFAYFLDVGEFQLNFDRQKTGKVINAMWPSSRACLYFMPCRNLIGLYRMDLDHLERFVSLS